MKNKNKILKQTIDGKLISVASFIFMNYSKSGMPEFSYRPDFKGKTIGGNIRGDKKVKAK
jgi:hypothetical protein